MNKLIFTTKMVLWVFVLGTGVTGWMVFDIYTPDNWQSMNASFCFGLFIVSAMYVGLILRQHVRQKQLTDQITNLIIENHELHNEILAATVCNIGKKDNV